MARLQILELPGGSGDDRPPFILVVDQVPRDDAEFDALRRDLSDDVAQRIGARAVLAFETAIDIPANDTTAYRNAMEAESSGSRTERTDQAEAKLKALFDEAHQLQKQVDEARQWARHGYEIGQRHCGWSDHGVAPGWLTEGWPHSFDSCEHLKKAAEYDTALSRVLEVAADLEAAEAHGGAWDANQQAARYIRAAVGRSRDEETRKP